MSGVCVCALVCCHTMPPPTFSHHTLFISLLFVLSAHALPWTRLHSPSSVPLVWLEGHGNALGTEVSTYARVQRIIQATFERCVCGCARVESGTCVPLGLCICVYMNHVHVLVCVVLGVWIVICEDSCNCRWRARSLLFARATSLKNAL